MGLCCAGTGVGLDDPCGTLPTQDIVKFFGSNSSNSCAANFVRFVTWLVAFMALSLVLDHSPVQLYIASVYI